jgi:hypothetical protein
MQSSGLLLTHCQNPKKKRNIFISKTINRFLINLLIFTKNSQQKIKVYKKKCGKRMNKKKCYLNFFNIFFMEMKNELFWQNVVFFYHTIG